MVTTTTKESPDARTRARSLEVEPRAPRIARKRQMRWVVAGVLLIVGSALVFATVWSRAGSGLRVLVLSRSVDAGHVLTPADLREVRVSADEALATVSASSESSVVGRAAAVPMAEGSLLTPSALGSARHLRRGQAIVGLALKPGMFPPGLSPGDRVRVVGTGEVSATGPGPSPLTAASTGVVVALQVDPSSSDGTAVVALRVDASAADQVALLASAGQASLVLLPAGS